MAVDIQGESGGGMAQVPLYGFHAVTVLERQNGKGMAEVVYPAFWCSDLPGQLLVMVVDGLCPEIVASGRGEDQRRLLFLWGGPTLP